MTTRSNISRFGIDLPDGFIERLAQAVADAVVAAQPTTSNDAPWLSGAQAAADYLGWPKARVHRWIRELPHYRAGGRLMFDAVELDAWVRSRCESSERREELPGSHPGQELLRDGGVRPLGAFHPRSTPPGSL